MGLEAATYVNDFVTSNPTGGDGRSQGDDHLRLIKSVLQATFPLAIGARKFRNDDAGATDTLSWTLYRKSASPAVDDLLASYVITGDSSTGVERVYGRLQAKIDSPTNTAEKSSWLIKCMKAGAETIGAIVTGDGLLGVPNMIGVTANFAGTTAPVGWLLCFGQAVSRTTYAALFAVISTTFGVGDGSTTFNLPDLRGRVVAGKDDMGGSSANRLTSPINGDNLGEAGGSQSHALVETELAAHTHTGTTNSDGSHTHTLNNGSNIMRNDAGGGYSGGSFGATVTISVSSGGAHTHGFTTASTGSGTAHNNVQPTIIMNKIIYTGVV